MKLDAMNRFTATVSRRLFGKPMQEADAGLCSFEVEADAVMSRQRTQRAQTIVRTAVGVVALLILWASLAHVDEVTRGDGRVIPSRQLQLVQSLDGGIVRAIHVREGEAVQEGQVLLLLGPAGEKTRLEPRDRDNFETPLASVRFEREANGVVSALVFGEARVWALRFVRDGPAPKL